MAIHTLHWGYNKEEDDFTARGDANANNVEPSFGGSYNNLTLEQERKKMPCSDKKADFLGTNFEKLVREVLEALPLETTTVAVVYSRYWTDVGGTTLHYVRRTI